MRSPKSLHRDVPRDEADCEVLVKTGDRRGAGTDSKLFIILHDNRDRATKPLRLSNRLTTNCRGQLSQFFVQTNLKDIQTVSLLEFYLEKFGIGDLWFVEWIKVIMSPEGVGRDSVLFPVHRWIGSCDDHIFICPNDTSLPQFAPPTTIAFRAKELIKKREHYRYTQKFEGGPAQVLCLWFSHFIGTELL